MFHISQAQPRAPEARVAVRIGSVPRRTVTSLTTIRFDEGRSTYVFGPEVPASFRMETRVFLRRSAEGTPRKVTSRRFEIVVDPKHASAHEVKAGHILAFADLPPGQRRVQQARLQRRAKALAPVMFDDLEQIRAAFPDPAALDDRAALRALHALPVNLFSSAPGLSACIAADESGAFASYDDEVDLAGADASDAGGPARAKLTARTREDGTYALGVVADPKAVRDHLFLHPRLKILLDLSGDGALKLKVPGRKTNIRVPDDLSAQVIAHFGLALEQALAGAGEKHAKHLGWPVADYAHDLFFIHLKEAVRRTQGRYPQFRQLFEGVADPDGAVSDEDGDPEPPPFDPPPRDED
ncbi:hypothetical protein J5J86_20595 [Aquabacter sp. L1I39]|uniref:hypothetical protein n=1 Tax=Aquabacter sp. L1I39 TaxID=2820278 RepID=UPI001AD9A1CB|nr:hypothetical protein [Aquabacter sp. L1I39]QTL03128.1 hypothetical protein J5J86_20595 [Aquabacter sp. L1I39]